MGSFMPTKTGGKILKIIAEMINQAAPKRSSLELIHT